MPSRLERIEAAFNQTPDLGNSGAILVAIVRHGGPRRHQAQTVPIAADSVSREGCRLPFVDFAQRRSMRAGNAIVRRTLSR